MRDEKALRDWVARLSVSELPVLKQTDRDLSALRENSEELSVAEVSAVIARDPLMTVKLLRYLQQHKHKVQTTEIIQVEQALLMLGVEPFFAKVPMQPHIEDLLHSHLNGLPRVLRVIHRLHRASEYAKAWAVYRRDLRYEEVRIAALLHDLAEVLMWCFAPESMLQISNLQKQDKTLRSRVVQDDVLGFALIELQRELAIAWELPELLLTLMDDLNAKKTRVRNVILAVNLARHSANGWDDAGLHDDYVELADLLHIPFEQALGMMGDVAQQGLMQALQRNAGV